MHYTLSILTALLLLGCGDAPQHNSVQTQTKQNTIAKTQQPTGVKKTVAPALVKHEATPSQEEVVNDVEKAKDEVEKSVGPRLTQVQNSVANGAAVFQKCTACHGLKAEKAALGKSQVIAGWETAKITKALNGYKDGSYGGTMKAVMQAQVKSLSAEEVDAVTEYISSL